MLVYHKNPNKYRHGHSNYGKASSQLSSPAANIIERDNEFQIQMAIPGYEKKDIVIDIDDNLLKISSGKEQDQKEGDQYLKHEFMVRKFERSFELPKHIVDIDKIEAKYSKGVLSVVISKLETAWTKPAREISIA